MADEFVIEDEQLQEPSSNLNDFVIEGEGPAQNTKDLTHTLGQREPLHPATSGGPTTISTYKPVRTFLMRTIRPLLEWGGMIGGGAVATPPAVVAAPGTSGLSLAAIPAMAAAGYGSGSLAADKLSDAIGLTKPIPMSPVEAAIKSVDKMKEGALMELIGQAPGKIIDYIAPKLVRMMGFGTAKEPIIRNGKTIGYKETEPVKALNIAEDMSVKLTPAEVKDSTTLNWLEKGASPSRVHQRKVDNLKALIAKRDELIRQHGGQGTRIDELGKTIQRQVDDLVKAQEIAKGEALQAVRNKALSRLGTNETYTSLGENTQDLLTKASAVRDAKVNELYSQRNILIPPNAEMEIPNLQKAAKQMLAEDAKKPGGFRLSGDFRRKLKSLAQKPPVKVKKGEMITPELEAAQRLDVPTKLKFNVQALIGPRGVEADLNDIIAGENALLRLGQPGMKLQSSALGHMAEELKEALGKDLSAFSPEVADAHILAKKYYMESKDLLSNAGVFRLMKTDPEKAFNMVINSQKLQSVIHETLGDEGFKPFKDKLTSKILGADTDQPLSSKMIQNNLKKFGPEKLSQFFNPQELADFQQLTETTKGIEELFNANGPGQPNHLLVRLLNANPVKVMHMIVEPNNPGNIDLMESVVGKAGILHIQEKFLESELLKLTKYGNFDPSRVSVALNKYGEATLERLFRDNPEALQGIRDLALIGKYTTMPKGISKRMSIVHTLASAKWHFGLLGARTMIAKLYLSEAGRNLLAQGLRITPKSPQANGWMVKALQVMLTQEDINDELRKGETFNIEGEEAPNETP